MPRNATELAQHLTPTDRVAWRALQALPNIGPAMAYDLLRLGIRSPQDLAGRSPDEMYETLGTMDGVRHDPCVRDVFAAVIHHAETGEPQPWWHFTPERKSKGSTAR